MQDMSHLIDLASARLGGHAVAANDEFFGPKENLLKPEPPVSMSDTYTDRGKWMDGWETRRRRTPGHDWCIVKLGLAGLVHSIVVDTSFFRGNYPSHCSLDGCGLPDGADASAPGVVWHPVVGRTELSGDARNAMHVAPAAQGRRLTHVRLNIFPDGGVARLRVLGEVLPLWTRVLASGGDVDLAAAVNGGYVVDASDRFFGEPRNLLVPYPPSHMGDGWETKRRRSDGHDWAVIRLGIAGVPRRAEIDTAFFKGNYPDRASIDAAVVPDDAGGVSADVSSKAVGAWRVLLEPTQLQPDHLHGLDLRGGAQATHVRLNIVPDGGVSRFRLFGVPDAGARRGAVLRQLNSTDDPELRAVLADFCGAPEWLDGVAAARPFASAAALRSACERAAGGVSADGWREAFRHHPRIGEHVAERAQSPSAAAQSSREQSSMEDASAADRAALAEANKAYEERFGHVFVVAASCRTPQAILHALRERMSNDPESELRVAADEQKKITNLRLARLLE